MSEVPMVVKKSKKQRKEEMKAKKAKEAEELRIKLRKDHLSREVKMENQNVVISKKSWYELCMASRLPEFKQDMEVAWHWFEHALDLKDFIIYQLQNELEEAEIQDRMKWQSHMEIVDKMICSYGKTINEADQLYCKDLEEIMYRKNIEIKGILENHIHDETHIKTILFAAESNFKQAQISLQKDYVTKRDDETKKNTHFLELVSGKHEKQVQSSIAAIKKVMTDYYKSTEDMRKQLTILKAKDDYYLNMIKNQEVRTNKLLDKLNNLQEQINTENESQKTLALLKNEKDEVYNSYLITRKKVLDGNQLDENQLIYVTTESNITLEHLNSLVEKGEKLLQLGSLCRKLETRQEKIIPFDFPIYTIKKDEQENYDGEWLHKFWQRLAVANAKSVHLKKVLNELQKENEELVEVLQITLDAIKMM